MASNEWLVRKLHEQDKKIEALSRGGTGVGHTSIAPGENLTVISDNGEVVLGAGGVEHVGGPTPATPSAPTLKLGFGTIEVTWDGSFAEGEDEDGVPLVAPVDFDVVEVHCSTDPEEEEWGEDTMRGQIKTREGGTITVGGFDVDDEVFVCLIALAKTGKRSAPSATASLVIEGLDFSALFNELDAANATIKNAGEVLVTEQGTLDEKLTEVDGTLNDLGQDLAAVEDAQAQLGTDLTDVMTSVDGKNTITWDPSAPSKVSNPGKAVGDTWYRTSGNSIIGFWKWDGTDWVTQLLDKTTIPLIDIGAGTFGSLTGSRLDVASVAADRVLIGSGGNVVPWGQVTSGATYAPHEPYGPSGSTAALTPADTTRGLPAHVTVTRTSSGSWASIMSFWAAPGQKLPVDEGVEYVFSVRVYSANVSQARLSLFAYNHGGSSTANNSGVFASSTGTALSENVVEITVRGKVPAGVGYCLPYLQSSSAGAVGVVSVDLRKSIGTTLIEPGAVTTPKLSADVLEVKNLKATTGQLNEAVINKLFSDVVVAKTAVAEQFIGENAILTGAVTAPKITASEELWAKIAQFVQIRAEHIEADAIDGMVITGATIRSAATGARVQLSASGIESYNDTNERTFFASASTGNVSMTGELYTGEPGSERVVLDNSLWNSVEVDDPDTGTKVKVPGAGVRIGVDSLSGVDIYHGSVTATDGRFVDQAIIRGPGGRATTVYGKVSAAGSLPANNYVASSAWDNSGALASRVFVNSSSRLASLRGYDTGSYTASTVYADGSNRAVFARGYDTDGERRAQFATYGVTATTEMCGYDAAGVTRALVSASERYQQVHMTTFDSSGDVSASVGAYGDTGFSVASGTNVRPFNVKYRGTGDSWLIPFAKQDTDWGYVGSTGAMGVNDFGIQSAASKNLVLTTTTGSAGIIAKTNGDVTFSDSKGVNFSNIPVSSGTGVNVTAGGWFQKNTSSLRYKTDVETVDMSGFDVLSLEPKSFVYKDQKARFEKPRNEWGEYEEEIFANGLPTSYGLIAEEVEDAGGQFAVNYDQEGLPDSLNYGLIGVALIPTVRDLRDRITELERQLNE